MTKISDMTPLPMLPATGAYVPVEKTGSTVNYRFDLSVLSNLDGLLFNASNFTIPTGVDMVSTTGADALDHGGANYVAGTARTARSGFTSANARNFVLSKEQTITPQMFYDATDPDFQNAAQGAFDYHAATAGDVVNPWYRSNSKIVFPATSIGYDFHAPLEPGYTGIFEGEDTGYHDTHATPMRWSGGNSSGWRFQDINTTGASATNADHFAPSGSILRNMFLEGGLDAVSTEGEYHAVHARTRVILENIGISKWQGDGINITADVSQSFKGEASLSQISTCRILHTRNGVAITGADANVINIKSVDIVYARRWGFADHSFLGIRGEGCHTAGCGFFNPTYLPSLSSLAGNTYAVVVGMEVGASTNAPSGTTADNAWWYYCYAGGPSAPLNIVAWTNGLTWDAGGSYYTSGAGAPTTWDDCYSETGEAPAQFPFLALRIGGLHGAGVKGASFGAHNGIPTALGALTVETDGNSSIRTQVGSGGKSSNGAIIEGEILGHFNPVIGGANALSLTLPSFDPTLLYFTMWRGYYGTDAVPYIISTNSATAGSAPWGAARLNFPGGFGCGGKKVLSGTAAPTSGAYIIGDYMRNSAPAVGSPKGWYCTVSGSPGTWVSEGNL